MSTPALACLMACSRSGQRANHDFFFAGSGHHGGRRHTKCIHKQLYGVPECHVDELQSTSFAHVVRRAGVVRAAPKIGGLDTVSLEKIYKLAMTRRNAVAQLIIGQ